MSCSIPENSLCLLVRQNLDRWNTMNCGRKKQCFLKNRSITCWDEAKGNRNILLHCQKALWKKNLEIQNKADNSYQPLTLVSLWGIRPKQINAKEKIA